MRSRPILHIAILAVTSLLTFGAAISTAWALPPTAQTTMTMLGDEVHANAVAFDSAGTLWFAGSTGWPYQQVVGHLNSDGTVTEYNLEQMRCKCYSPAGITRGPDGVIWATQFGPPAIYRFGPAGETTRFPLPADLHPTAITAGGDGALWVIAPYTDMIGRVSTSGQVTKHRFDPESEPGGITLGPDGNIWFTLTGADKIGRITPGGTRKLFDLPQTMPRDIAPGPGGLWFTEGSSSPEGRRGRNRIGRITTSGQVRQFRVPARYGTERILPGPDGKIWFTSTHGMIEWMTPGGELSRRACLNDSCTLPPGSLAFDASGALWFGTDPEWCRVCGGLTAMSVAQAAGMIGRLDDINPTEASTFGRRD